LARPESRVIEVRLAVGEWSCVQAEQLVFCYRVITEETPLAGSSLEIDRLPGEVKCEHCGYAGRPQYWDDAQWLAPVPTLTCPQCSQTVSITHGDECAIRAIKYAN
jgi:hydrogenase nickel incorporation protein HypA/HybF